MPLRSKKKEKEQEKDLGQGEGPSGLGGWKASNAEGYGGSPLLTPYPKPASAADGKRLLAGLGIPERAVAKHLDALMVGELRPFDIEEWITEAEWGAS